MAKHCKSDRLRCLRCSEGHTTDSCKTKTAHCPQCGGEHAAWDRHCPVLAAYFANQEDPMKKTTNPNTESKTDTGTQTKSPTLKDTTTSPRPTNTKDAATVPVKLPRTRTISVQTDDLPALSQIVEEPAGTSQHQGTAKTLQAESGDPDWWRRRTRQDARGTVHPPTAPKPTDYKRSEEDWFTPTEDELTNYRTMGYTSRSVWMRDCQRKRAKKEETPKSSMAHIA